MGDKPLSLIAGLGNPGREYAQTRHNIGFMVVEAIAADLGAAGSWRPRFGAEVVSLIGSGLVLVKPMSFMNDSGIPLQAVAGYFKIPSERCLVICDDLDRPYGRLRMRMAGGHGGQNGLRSIIGTMSEKFPRLRVGIGRDQHTSENAIVSRVLGRFSADEQPRLTEIIDAAKTGALQWAREGVDPAMRFINTFGAPEPPPKPPRERPDRDGAGPL